ncbi:hypothetical protein [Bergeyella zoohelcum]|uniref:Lipoprotein n=1 Tax=Bergeyella zoohelcum TaxID=1015 RepID=A0A376BXJ1_9FLAO|nr:hypothetical protein [Bergeyella zoohelcum]EKB56880.1 hypothetical protein HMPREF9700_02332 [Bergeyella zoohelcum CCUG 30536]EKB56884.1 hypothetical protein HMPREF9700_02328 [Bergeyella zoohelcum CCUG 30536]SSZ46362.1 Uncharacterised protein [Bergeyella zoohelcum]
MKLYNILMIYVLFLLSCKSNNINYDRKLEITKNNTIPKEYIGRYTAYIQTEQTSAGMASITYNFEINKVNAYLETQTYHEPIRCNGIFRIINKKDHLELYYDGKNDLCKSAKPNFRIKKEKGKYFIKGIGGELTYLDWQKLKKVK